ncbi:MAG: hypothetical protein ACP5OR_09015, partial [Candidatus Dormibacteria bacterium]
TPTPTPAASSTITSQHQTSSPTPVPTPTAQPSLVSGGSTGTPSSPPVQSTSPTPQPSQATTPPTAAPTPPGHHNRLTNTHPHHSTQSASFPWWIPILLLIVLCLAGVAVLATRRKTSQTS